MSSPTSSPTSKVPSQETEEDEKVENLGGITRVVKEYGQGLTCYAVIGTLCAVCNGATTVIFFWFFKDLIDIGLLEPTADLALELLIKFLGAGAGFLIFNLGQFAAFGTWSNKISVRLREAYFKILLTQEIGFYDKRNSGAINTALITDCLNISGMGTNIGMCMQHLCTFIGSFILSFTYSWELSLVLLCAVPFMAAAGAFAGKMQAQSQGSKETNDQSDKANLPPEELCGAFANEVLQSIRSVQAMPVLLEAKLREYKNKLDDLIPFAKKAGIGMGIGWGGFMFCMLGIMYALGFWYGGRMIDQGRISVGDMFLCIFAIMTGGMAIGQFGTANQDVVKASVSANKFFTIADRVPESRVPEDGKPISMGKGMTGRIRFEGVDFRYPTAPDTQVLDKVSFEVEPGTTMAIVGPSGSGKSTIVNLLERYYDPEAGDITIDGEKIHNYDINELRSKIGYVSQLPLLFAESIMENIRGGDPDISDEQVMQAAKMADAHDFIMNLTDKYQTNVGEMGNRLSGGQKQRISIARAIVSNPLILLLDEATSALDTKSEREVQRAIDNIAANSRQTIVVIAHRLSTIKNADKILVLVDGEVEEEGTHQELIDKDGMYALLVREQQVTGTDDVADEAGASADDEYKVSPTWPDEGGATSETKNLKPNAMDKVDSYSTGGGAAETTTIDIDEKDSKGDAKDDKKEDEKDEEEAVPEMGGTKRLMADYAQDFKCLFCTSVFFALLAGLLFPVAFAYFFPDILKQFAEEGYADCEVDPDTLIVEKGCTKFEESALRLVIPWVVLGTYGLIVFPLQSYFFAIYATKVTNRVRLQWFGALLRQDIPYHDEHGSAKLNGHLSVEAKVIEAGLGDKMALFWSSVTTFLAGIGIGLYNSWRASLVFLGLSPLLVIGGAVGTMMWMGEASADPFLSSGAVSQEIFGNIRTVLAFPHLITSKTTKFADELAKGAKVAQKRAVGTGVITGLNLGIMQGVIYGVGMYAGIRFVEKRWVDFGEVMGALFGVMMMGMGLGQIGAAFPALKTAGIAANKFYVAKEREPVIRKPDEAFLKEPIKADNPLQGSIEFKNVSFAYPSNPDRKVLDDVSFSVPKGSSLAIVGPSGSGKSTVISLLLRFYDHKSGDIVMDDENKNQNYDLSYLRSSMGLVSQMPLLFDASISENIRGGNTKATQEEVEAAAKSASAHEFITKLEKGYDTNVGELGGKLSGGQRQRIAIARALLPNPSILLLDEATSALDSKSEREVQGAIDEITAKGSQTTITIAHRLSTIRNSDRIIVLVEGKVKESGNHQELMEQRGVYSALVNAQTLVEQKTQLHRQKSGGDAVEEVHA